MTNAEARFNKSLRPRKPEGSLGRTAQNVHLDSHTVPELWRPTLVGSCLVDYRCPSSDGLVGRDSADSVLHNYCSRVARRLG